jgi:hypothetical protein
METPREESDQLPEEAPSEQVTDDEGHAASREEANENPGGRGEQDSAPGDATGNPANAG